ncbi:hypothetical protein HK100_008984 [Physocladia obscura]|uniref:Methyltransferase domain-containing protein n=1 Tax=Physocladia obscura TaxID=109957 RepID=A0AAD5TAU7_9FUNG|nr:hypothetical protein HK100_008984 [Physocladia obscura]
MSGEWDDHAKRYAKWSDRQTLPHAQFAFNALEIPVPFSQSAPQHQHSVPVKILDVAAGDGAFALTAARVLLPPPLSSSLENTGPMYQIIATDFSPEMIRILAEKASSQKLRVECRVEDGQPNGIKCIEEMYRVLKPGGKLVFTTWSDSFIPHLLLSSLIEINPSAAITHIASKAISPPPTSPNPPPPKPRWSDPIWLRNIEMAAALSPAPLDTAVALSTATVTVRRHEVAEFAQMVQAGPSVRAAMRAEGWTRDEDWKKVPEGIGRVFEKVYIPTAGSGGEDEVAVPLLSQANVVICIKGVQ